MKRILPGIAAIIMAVILNAFTIPGQKQPGSISPQEQPYFWYHVNGAGTQTLGTTINPDATIYKADAMSLEGCDDTATPVCLAGFSSTVSSGTSINGIGSLRIIKETP